MPNILSYTNAFPGKTVPQHRGGMLLVQSYQWPGAVQPIQTGPAVLTYAKAFPAISFPQKIPGKSTSMQNYIYPGALQPLLPVVNYVLMGQIIT